MTGMRCKIPLLARTPKTEHITPELKFLHWLKIEECIHYKIISLTYDPGNTSGYFGLLLLWVPYKFQFYFTLLTLRVWLS